MRVGLAISGGSTKIAFLIGATISVLRKYHKPSYLIGTSSGSIIATMIALRKVDTLIGYSTKYTLKTIFGVDISKRVNQVIGLYRLIKHGYMFTFKGLKKILKEEITEEKLKAYKEDKRRIPCYIHCYDVERNQDVYFDMAKLNRNELIDAILASCSIPLYLKPISMRGMKLFDGGLGNHIASEQLVKMHGKDMDTMISIYSRVKNVENYTYKWKGKALRVLERVLEIFITRRSEENEINTKELCKLYNVNNIEVFSPEIFQRTTFDADLEQNKRMYNAGLNLKIK